MRNQTSNRGIQGKGFGALAVAALAAAVVLMAAGPARARNEFQNGFEDQLGRIAAYGAVNLGLQILHGGYYPVVPVVQPSYYGSYYGSYYDGPRKLVVRYPKHYRQDRYRDSRYQRSPRHRDYGHYYSDRRGRHDDHRYRDDRGHRSRGKHHRDGRGRDGRGWNW